MSTYVVTSRGQAKFITVRTPTTSIPYKLKKYHQLNTQNQQMYFSSFYMPISISIVSLLKYYYLLYYKIQDIKKVRNELCKIILKISKRK
jgi:hypothetical protein